MDVDRPTCVLITSGPTREPIDPVRFLSNASSGRMGAALAVRALEIGCDVHVVTGPVEVSPPAGARVLRVTTANEMLAVCEELHPRTDIVIGAAAVSDFRPVRPLAEKRTRDGSKWVIELESNPDILAQLGSLKKGQVHAGFALETGEVGPALERARAKLARKNLDWIVLNLADAIGAESSRFWILSGTGEEIDLGELSKAALARELLARLVAASR